jgi:hypothetical protein
LLKIRIDRRVRYQGKGDVAPNGPPNYFQKLFAKYQKGNCPDWLRDAFPNDEVRRELLYLREEALYYAIEAAKLEVRTSRGWHHKRNVGDLQTLGGRLARLKKQASAESEIEQVESEIRDQRSRRPRARAKVEELLDLAQYRWHTVMFTATEYLRSPGRYAFLPPKAIQDLCHWLSFPEIGMLCTHDTIKAVGRHFPIDRRNGKSYRVYQHQILRNEKDLLEDRPLEEEFLKGIFKCSLCGLSMEGATIGHHLTEVEHIPSELVGVTQDPFELYRTDTDQTLAART